VTLFSRKIESSLSTRLRIRGVDGAQIGCEVAVFFVLNVFFFIEEDFTGAFCFIMMTVAATAAATATTRATATSNWWVVGGGKVFGRFYIYFDPKFREMAFDTYFLETAVSLIYWKKRSASQRADKGVPGKIRLWGCMTTLGGCTTTGSLLTNNTYFIKALKINSCYSIFSLQTVSYV